MPNELMLALRGAFAGHGIPRLKAFTLFPEKSTMAYYQPLLHLKYTSIPVYQHGHILLGLGLTKVGVPGIKPFSIAKIALMRPELPAAGSEWPILLLIYRELAMTMISRHRIFAGHRSPVSCDR